MLDLFLEIWPFVAGVLVLGVTLAASVHVVLFHRDTRAAIGWIGVLWLVPLVGTLLYGMLGVNRIHRRARSLRGHRPLLAPQDARHACTVAEFEAWSGADRQFAPLVELVERLTERPLLSGSRIAPLVGGDQAFPAMLDAIDRAARSVSLSTYLFDNDRVGRQFADALARAVARGVDVRLLVDDVGMRYTFPPMVGGLRRSGVRTERFMRTLVPRRFTYSNLRNHRKILVVDGRVGFTGGMNIREGAHFKLNPRRPVQDVHFRLEGPVVGQLQEVFVDDWAFTCGELLKGESWFPPLAPVGESLARGIPNGPDEDLGEMGLAVIGALACARSRVAVMTPYFLPDDAVASALNVAALRGVDVDIVLPASNNLWLVKWASTAMLWQVLERGCKVWLSPPPFDHTKLMVVDRMWTLFGSGNWDPRSFQLNFEFNVECYDRSLAATLDDLVRATINASRPVTLADVEARRLPVKVRDGIARLFSPYL